MDSILKLVSVTDSLKYYFLLICIMSQTNNAPSSYQSKAKRILNTLTLINQCKVV